MSHSHPSTCEGCGANGVGDGRKGWRADALAKSHPCMCEGCTTNGGVSGWGVEGRGMGEVTPMHLRGWTTMGEGDWVHHGCSKTVGGLHKI